MSMRTQHNSLVVDFCFSILSTVCQQKICACSATKTILMMISKVAHNYDEQFVCVWKPLGNERGKGMIG